jgi:hypothetical protein
MSSLADLYEAFDVDPSPLDACVLGFGIGACLALFFMIAPFLKGGPEV